MVAVQIEGDAVWVRPWLYVHACPHGHQIPVLLLDTDLDAEQPATTGPSPHRLYGGDAAYRLKQEIILGIGGIRLLRALGFEHPDLSSQRGSRGAADARPAATAIALPPQDLRPGESPYDDCRGARHAASSPPTRRSRRGMTGSPTSFSNGCCPI